MRITSISDCGRGRKRIEISHEDAEDRTSSFVLSGKEARFFRLTQGEALPQEAWLQILSFLRKSCLQKSADLLSRQDYSRARLRDKLLRSFPEEVADPVLEELAGANYINDRRYAENYVRAHMYDKSRMRIGQDLINRGIGEETASVAVAEVFGDALRDGEDPERAQIRRILLKKGFDAGTTGFTEKQKLTASICRRGFSVQKIISVMREETGAEG